MPAYKLLAIHVDRSSSLSSGTSVLWLVVVLSAIVVDDGCRVDGGDGEQF